MREDDELRLAMVVLGAIHAEFGCTVTLRREAAREPEADAAGAACGPPGWRARAVDGRCPLGGPSAWAPRPYEAVCRLVERLDGSGEEVA